MSSAAERPHFGGGKNCGHALGTGHGQVGTLDGGAEGEGDGGFDGVGGNHPGIGGMPGSVGHPESPGSGSGCGAGAGPEGHWPFAGRD